MSRRAEAEARKVYVVTDGDYSDYHIMAVFSTRELAEAYIAEHNRHPRDQWDEEHGVDEEEAAFRHTKGAIEEWPLDQLVGKKGAHRVTIDEDGTVVESDFQPWTWPHEATYRSGWTRAQIAGPGFSGSGNPLRITGHGKTDEHARRSAEQYRREYLASGEAR